MPIELTKASQADLTPPVISPIDLAVLTSLRATGRGSETVELSRVVDLAIKGL